MGGVLHHQRELKECAQKNDDHLLQIATAKPQDTQGNEDRHWHIANETNDRLKKLASPWTVAHENAQRRRQQNRSKKPSYDSKTANRNVGTDSLFCKHSPE